MTNRDCFPYVCSEEPNVPKHLLVRAEGLPLRKAIWSGVGYLRKYRQAKWSAPDEEVQYFIEQSHLFHRLTATGESDGLRLALVGDLMWLRDSWDTFLSPDVLAYLNGYELVLGNLESPISTSTSVPHLLPDYFSYNSDPRLVTSFCRSDGSNTFSALATANNHCLDRGDVGLADTLAFLDQQGIAHSGVRRSEDDRPWVTLEVNGHKIGFYSACWGLNNPDAVRRSRFHVEIQPGLAPEPRLPPDLSRMRSVLDDMTREGIEFKIVSLHWGHEFEFYPCPKLMQIGREIVAAGADVLMGTHPHVVQPMEVCLLNGYEKQLGDDLPALQPRTGCLLDDATGVPRKALIVYSLGNFATAMYTLHCRIGLVLGLHLKPNESTGRLDWHRPEPQFVINLRRDRATGHRRLVLLDRYLRECERQGDTARKVRAMKQFLEVLLLGQ